MHGNIVKCSIVFCLLYDLGMTEHTIASSSNHGYQKHFHDNIGFKNQIILRILVSFKGIVPTILV